MKIFGKTKSKVEEVTSSKLMKVYRKDWMEGRIQTELCQPGLRHPEVPEWSFSVPSTNGQAPGIQARTYKVIFRNGMAEVDQKLGTYLINELLAYARPQKPLPLTPAQEAGRAVEAAMAAAGR